MQDDLSKGPQAKVVRQTAYGMLAAMTISENNVTGLVQEEIAYAQNLAPLRRRTWVAGRLALREALKALGVEHPEAILPNHRGAPFLRARELHASISHKQAIAVALVSKIPQVGVDIELVTSVSKAIEKKILTPEERQDIADLANPDSMILRYFSAKEAIYKALDPYVQRYVGFQEVTLSYNKGEFKVYFKGPYAIEVTSNVESLLGEQVILSMARCQVRP